MPSAAALQQCRHGRPQVHECTHIAFGGCQGQGLSQEASASRSLGAASACSARVSTWAALEAGRQEERLALLEQLAGLGQATFGHQQTRPGKAQDNIVDHGTSNLVGAGFAVQTAGFGQVAGQEGDQDAVGQGVVQRRGVCVGCCASCIVSAKASCPAACSPRACSTNANVRVAVI